MRAQQRAEQGYGQRVRALLGPRYLDGPHLAWPRPVDLIAERWGRTRPRVRALVTAATIVAVVLAVTVQVRAVKSRWGGSPVPALVATSPLHVGAQAVGLRRVLLPPHVVPQDALHAVPPRARLAFALPAGAVLTRAHVDARGPAAGLPPHLRAVPVPVVSGWGIVAGGWVDVWVLDAGEEPSALVAKARPVLHVRDDEHETTALVGLDADEVAQVTGALALGRILLTHAPPPSR